MTAKDTARVRTAARALSDPGHLAWRLIDGQHRDAGRFAFTILMA